eukprot:SAG22_NODE_5595_length_988_cov_0.688414_1_plen_195_part_01
MTDWIPSCTSPDDEQTPDWSSAARVPPPRPTTAGRGASSSGGMSAAAEKSAMLPTRPAPEAVKLQFADHIQLPFKDGEGIRQDPRLAGHWLREDYLLHVIEDPTFARTSSCRLVSTYFFKHTATSVIFWVVLACYVATTALCATAQHSEAERGICAGPTTHHYSDYWPTILNTFSTFLHVIYASQIYTRYCALYA